MNYIKVILTTRFSLKEITVNPHSVQVANSDGKVQRQPCLCVCLYVFELALSSLPQGSVNRMNLVSAIKAKKIHLIAFQLFVYGNQLV